MNLTEPLPCSPSPSAQPAWLSGELSQLPVLSVRQPWASSIVYFGKRLENRGWTGRYLAIQMSILSRGGNRFLIHASSGMTPDEMEGWQEFVHDRAIAPSPELLAAIGITKFRDLPRGGIVGVATFTRWVTQSDSPWYIGPGALELGSATPLDFYPCKGTTGFFHLPKIKSETPTLL